jgi:prepilin-type N-terminal cleavage/methylation domain-containing protein
MMISCLNQDKGFSLVEVIVSMLLLVTVGGGLAGLYFTSVKAHEVHKERQQALLLAENELEQIRGNKSIITDLFPGHTVASRVGNSETHTLSGYERRIVLEFYVEPYALFAITVRVEMAKSHPLNVGTKMIVDYSD